MPKVRSKSYRPCDVEMLVSGITQSLKLSNFNNDIGRRKGCVSQAMTYERLRYKAYERTVKSFKEVQKKTDDEPFLTISELIEQGRLINEAVRKLQMMDFEDLSSNESDNYNDDDDDDQDKYRIRRAHYSYDSEDEPVPGVYNPPFDL